MTINQQNQMVFNDMIQNEDNLIQLWPGSAPTDPEAPKNSKTQKSDSKVTFGAPAKVIQKLLKSDSTVAKKANKSLFSYFWVNFK